MDRKFYRDFADNWDNGLLQKTITPFLSKDKVLLDIGAGAGIIPEMNFKGKVKNVIGVDPDKRVLENKYLDKAYIGFGEKLNFINSKSIDIIICNNVLEHIKNPELFYKEVHRILKPAGIFISKTPNKYHYVPLIAKVTPNRFHEFFNKLRGRSEEDTYPTLYKVNSIKAQRHFASITGFEIIKINTVEARPEYLRLFFLIYLIGFLYERVINFFNISQLKVIIISIFKKKEK